MNILLPIGQTNSYKYYYLVMKCCLCLKGYAIVMTLIIPIKKYPRQQQKLNTYKIKEISGLSRIIKMTSYLTCSKRRYASLNTSLHFINKLNNNDDEIDYTHSQVFTITLFSGIITMHTPTETIFLYALS